jgi:2-C-methyl-D-erythritol 4-phosphate cytidylyltransferase
LRGSPEEDVGALKIAAVIPGAGSGERLAASENKPFVLLGQKPLLIHTVQKFQESPEIDEIVVVVQGKDVPRAESLVAEYHLGKVVAVVEGGERRQESVYRGLKKLEGRGIACVLVHDAVRPFLDSSRIHEVIRVAKEHGAAILAIQPKDTIKLSNGTPFIQKTLDRSRLWAVQTPQCFSMDLLMKAYDSAIKDEFLATDDSSLVERLGVNVRIVEGSYDNIKITTPEDLELAEMILHRQSSSTF